MQTKKRLDKERQEYKKEQDIIIIINKQKQGINHYITRH